ELGVPLPDEVGLPPLTFSLLSFMEKFIIRFVAALSTRLGRPGLVESRIAAVVGGSLGGNLALRLARREGPWARNAVAWDAGSVWRSLVRPLSTISGSPSDDVHTKEILVGVLGATPKVGPPETGESRDAFFKDVFDQGLPPSNQTQPQQWYGDDFWAKSQYIAGARLDRRETYTCQFRQWHWRVSLEELMWSW